MSVRFTKTVKNARRGIALSRKFKHRFLGAVALLLLLLLLATLLVWWQEDGFSGSF